MKFILQIFTGSWHTAKYPPDEIIRKIREVSNRIRVDKVIAGWNTDAQACRKTGAFLHKLGIEMLLWLPVFSETDGISDPDGALDIFGNPISVAAEQAGGFRFACMSSGRNIRIVKDIYEQYFQDCGFDGVFLDRIRSRSFASGVPGVLSCGCGRCREAFLKKGVDISEIRKRYEELGDAFFDMASWPANGAFVPRDTAARRFFEAKEEIVAESVTDLCRYFKCRGMTVGLDLFAPFVSRIAGQNYSLITKNADFIKPMLYRKTEAPAGIGYEYAMFRKHAPEARGISDVPMDRAFLDTQLEALAGVPCAKYPGIEINRVEGIAETDAGYITESLAAVRDHGFEGAVLCWNLMQAPQEHIDAAAGLTL